MSVFNDITGFETFTISADVDSTINVYANGRQQVRVYVRMVPMAGDDYVNISDLDSEGELLDALSLVNYHSDVPLKYIGGAVDENGTSWSYTRFKGHFDQPVLTQAYTQKNTSNNQHEITFELYVMCPEDENNRSISVAASVKLGNGNIITTSKSNGGFDSSVSLKGATTPNYKIAYHNGSQSENDDLYVEVNRVKDGEINGDPAWVDNYTVGLRRGKFSWHHMDDSDAVRPPTGWAHPPEFCLYLRHYAYTHQIANLCYYWKNYTEPFSTPIAYMKDRDLDAHFESVDVNQDPSKFNFTVARFEDTDDSNSDHDYESATPQKAVLSCYFFDQFGNEGVFYAYPYGVTGDTYDRGRRYEFSSSKP